MVTLALSAIPSPPISTLHLGPLSIHIYALCILAGITVALWLSNRRWIERGGRSGDIGDIAIWAVPFGIVGARLYHVITDPQLYFAAGRDPWKALAIWDGGLGIWGAVAVGALGAWIGARRKGIRLAPLADAIAPGLALAQGIGRLGNWFNQELFGGPTALPWAVHITAATDGSAPGFYHPTFLYELMWDVGVAVVVIWADRRFRLGHGRAFALYVAAYTLGRAWIEWLRVDPANQLLGVRVNDWVALVVFIAAVTYLIVTRTTRRETPTQLYIPRPDTAPGRHTAREEPLAVSAAASSSRRDGSDDARRSVTPVTHPRER